MNDHFIDLRLNRGLHDHNESFWPSFTDIMMVILMVFLLAMVTLLIRNSELLRQLSATLEAEREAATLAQQIGQERDSLTLQLSESRQRMSDLQALIEQLNLQDSERLARISALETELDAERDAATAQITQLTDELTGSQAQITQLSDELTSSQVQITQLSDELISSQTQISGQLAQLEAAEAARIAEEAERERLTTESQALLAQLTELNERLAAIQAKLRGTQATVDDRDQQLLTLQEALATRSDELDAARLELVASASRYTTLTSDYDQLKTDYDLLFKPARTSEGKLTARAVYRGNDSFALTTPDGRTRTLGLNATESALQALAEEHCNLLYVQVVFPDAVNISHARAWQLTSRLHQYDYYFREGSCE